MAEKHVCENEPFLMVSDFIPSAADDFHIGSIDRERFRYWSLLPWTFFRRPSLYPLAVTLSIHGHHFHKTSLAAGD